MIEPPDSIPSVIHRVPSAKMQPVRVLLLDDEPTNLHLRTAILRQHGYHCIPASTIEEATEVFNNIDIAVLDYHLGSGQFGTEVASPLRRRRPHVPIIILSATLERHFGGAEDMHLLKGYSSVDDLLAALRSFEAKRRGKPVVVDARDFFYSRIAMAMGDDIVLEILDRDGEWQYVNEFFARLYEKKRTWFSGKNRFEVFPELSDEWKDIIRTVADTRETYVDRSFRCLPHLPKKKSRWNWNILVFPLKLHDNRNGAVLAARVIEKK